MKEYKVIVGDNGTKCWYLNGKRHREDGPAVEYANGTKCWYLNDKRHREDGPAIVEADGDKHWYLNGERHREDGPAIEYANGTKCWYLNGIKHKKINKCSLDRLVMRFRLAIVRAVCWILLPRGVWIGKHFGAYTCRWSVHLGKLDKCGVLQGLSDRDAGM